MCVCESLLSCPTDGIGGIASHLVSDRHASVVDSIVRLGVVAGHQVGDDALRVPFLELSRDVGELVWVTVEAGMLRVSRQLSTAGCD